MHTVVTLIVTTVSRTLVGRRFLAVALRGLRTLCVLAHGYEKSRPTSVVDGWKTAPRVDDGQCRPADG